MHAMRRNLFGAIAGTMCDLHIDRTLNLRLLGNHLENVVTLVELIDREIIMYTLANL